MEIILLKQARPDLEYRKKSGNKAMMKRITELLKDMAEHPFTGIGKPEPLQFGLAVKWSRRISHKHRIVYSLDEEGKLYVCVLAMRYHHGK